MKRMLSNFKSEKLAQELKDLETRADDELKDRWRSLYGTKPPQQDSPLSAGRGGCPPNAGECTRRTQAFGLPTANAGRQQHSDLSTIAGSREPTS